MIIVAITCLIVLWTRISRADYAGMARGLLKIPPDEGVYDDDPVRWGVIATIFWGGAGLAVGLYIALRLAFQAPHLGIEYTRSEEVRVGKECVRSRRSRWSPDNRKQKRTKNEQEH